MPCHRVREYVHVFGVVDPANGDDYYIISPKCNTQWMNEFLKAVSEEFKEDYLVICLDQASWHKSKGLKIPDNITLFYLPAYTPEMNPIEQIWKEVRKQGFKNTLFNSLNDVINKLVLTLNSLSNELVKSICGREWIMSML